jgi:hypothetical protein
MQLINLTFNFLNAFGSQSRATSKLYPPRPGHPASPAGLGIVESSESVEESESISEASEPDGEPPQGGVGLGWLNTGMCRRLV